MTTRNATDPLGQVIADYAPPLRGKLALRFIISAMPAAGLWYLMDWLERSLLIAVLALLVLPLSFHSLSLLLRWLTPGRRVTLHENGLVFGNDRCLWDTLSTIEYRLDLGSDYSTIENQVHQFRFVHKDGSVRSLDLEHNTVESHVPVEDLIEKLRRVPVPFEVDHEPKLRTESPVARAVYRDALMATQLRAGLDSDILSAQKSGIAAEVVAAFDQGQSLRARLAKRAGRSSLGLDLLVILSTFVLSVVILIGLISVLFLIIAIIQGLFDSVGLDWTVLDKRDFPIALPTFLVPVVLCTVSLGLTSKLGPWTEAAKAKAQKLGGLKDGLQDRSASETMGALLTAVEQGTPYAVYLRSFLGENYHYEEMTPIGGSDYVINTERRAIARDLDARLMAAAADLLPVFALANAQDASASKELRLLFVPDNVWRAAVVELIYDAKLVIVHLAAVTESVLLELEILNRLDRGSQTLLLQSPAFPMDSLTPNERTMLSRFPNRLVIDAPDWEPRLASLLNSLVKI